MKYKVKEIADLANISVRTLHHYDDIGLLEPEYISDNGYRFYSEKNIERLQQILFFKELDFSLKEIKEILDSPTFDKLHALNGQRELLIEKKKRVEKIIEAVDKNIISVKGELKMSSKDVFNSFDMKGINETKEKYAREVKEKFGHTKEYKEYEEKTCNYSNNQWEKIMKEGQEIFNQMSVLMNKEPGHIEVQKLVEKWREHISKNFYNCTPEILRGLGQMYVYDERFTKNIDKTKKGLAEFLSKAIEFYCDNKKKL